MISQCFYDGNRDTDIIDPDDIYVLDYIEKKSIKEERELTNCNEIFTNIELIREWVPSSLEYSQRGIDDIKIYIICIN